MGRMNFSAVKDGRDLQTYLGELEKDQTALEREVESLHAGFNIMRASGRGGNAGNGGGLSFAAKGGQLIRALIAKDFGRVRDLGAEPEPQGDWQTKLPLGSPLTSDSSTGSYTIPVGFYGDVFKIVEENSVMFPLVKKIAMDTRVIQIPVRNAITNMGWITSQSTAVISEMTPTFAEKSLTAYTLAGYIGLNESLLEDGAGVRLYDYFVATFGEDFATEFDNMVFNATATPAAGVFADAGVTLKQLGSGKASLSDIDVDDLLSLISSLSLKYRRGGRFFMSRTGLDSLRGLRDAQGRYIFQDATAGNPPQLLGYPVHACDEISSTPSAGAKVCAFFNPANVIVGQRIQIAIELYDRTAYAVQNEQVFIRARCRMGLCLPVPGAIAVMKLAGN